MLLSWVLNYNFLSCIHSSTRIISKCSVSEHEKYHSTQENGSRAIETKDEAFQTKLMQPKLPPFGIMTPTLTMCRWNDFATEGRLFFLVKIAGPPSLDTSWKLKHNKANLGIKANLGMSVYLLCQITVYYCKNSIFLHVSKTEAKSILLSHSI